MSNQSTSLVRCFCTNCQFEMPIAKKQSKRKEPGHLKKLFCIRCGDQHNFVEIHENSSYTLDIFKKEFELKNFVDGQRIKDWKQISKI